MNAPTQWLEELVTANRILAHEGVVDAFGHVSMRDPRDPMRYWMSCSRSPALVTAQDLMEFLLNGTPLDARGRPLYGERMIHGAMYEARPDVGAVVHNHAEAILPFTIGAGRLKPVIHVAGVIGAEVPLWDMAEEYGATDLLVRTMAQGRSMARAARGCNCLLMRGHGAVVAGENLRHAVVRAVYLQVNARVQSEAAKAGNVHALSDAEVALTAATQLSQVALDRAWEYLCHRAAWPFMNQQE
jgi:ribulose-5-phosphate 4-epimerase/fuculose-1-phosphate aldolase